MMSAPNKNYDPVEVTALTADEVDRAVAEALGGDITVGRAPGGGAEFRFTVPAGAPIA